MVCCFTYPRTVANDNTVQLGTHFLQILPGPHRRSYAKAKVLVHDHLDGTRSVTYQGARLAFQLLASASLPTQPATRRGQPLDQATPPVVPTERQPWKPAPNHPWKRMAAEALRRKQLRKARVTFSLSR